MEANQITSSIDVIEKQIADIPHQVHQALLSSISETTPVGAAFASG